MQSRASRGGPRPFPFDSAVALVTGGGSGIGRATAVALAGRGVHVIVADRDGVAAKETADAIGGEDHELDVTDRAATAEVADEVHTRHGALDILVNNAGVGLTGRFVDTPLSDWDWIIDINLLGIVNGCHAFGTPMLAEGRGHVVNVCSAMAYFPRATEPAYVTTKAAALALSRSLRSDWRPLGVGVTAICPGIIDTAIGASTRVRGNRSSQAVQDLFAKVGRSPELVAKAIIDSVERDRPVVPVGVEAWLGWAAHRLLPSRAMDRINQITFRGV